MTHKHTLSVGQDVKKRYHLCPVGGIANWFSHFLKRSKIKLPYDLAIPFLGIFPKEMKTGY